MPRSRNVGLARALSKHGYCSRSNAANLIRAGNVALNGRIRRDPETPVSFESDHISVNGQSITAAEKVYLMLNKPRGIVTTASDEKGRQTIYDLLPEAIPWLGPVGRLDKASEGLLLLTNDSEWAARISDPFSHLDKTYHVQINAVEDDLLLRKIKLGIKTSAETLRVTSATLLRSGGKNSWLEIVLHEGRNRHIRRIFDDLQIEVLRLVRVAVGPLTLGQLPKGTTRPLSDSERLAISAAISSGK
jgi:23S rRNA pseudouridine2605 synthase